MKIILLINYIKEIRIWKGLYKETEEKVYRKNVAYKIKEIQYPFRFSNKRSYRKDQT